MLLYNELARGHCAMGFFVPGSSSKHKWEGAGPPIVGAFSAAIENLR